MNSPDKPLAATVEAPDSRESAERPPSWRVGRKVPINVYDENGAPVCMCQTVEQARMIVTSVNFMLDCMLL